MLSNQAREEGPEDSKRQIQQPKIPSGDDQFPKLPTEFNLQQSGGSTPGRQLPQAPNPEALLAGRPYPPMLGEQSNSGAVASVPQRGPAMGNRPYSTAAPIPNIATPLPSESTPAFRAQQLGAEQAHRPQHLGVEPMQPYSTRSNPQGLPFTGQPIFPEAQPQSVRSLGQPNPYPMAMGQSPLAMGSAFGHLPFDNGMNLGAGNMWNHGNEGSGTKFYVVMCKDDVEVRASPTYADDTRIGHFLHPGQVVPVDERRMVQGSWFLHLADGRGWVFENKDRLLVMTEARDHERSLWHYSVVCEDDVETRASPTYSDDSRTGLVLGSGDCFAVDERCSVAGARFLKLADGRGWVFETKDRLLVMSEVRAKAQDARDFARGLWHYTVVCDDDIEVRAAPTYSDEARTGLMIHPGDCISVDERCRVAAVWFLRLADGRGWVFETKDSRRVMMQLH